MGYMVKAHKFHGFCQLCINLDSKCKVFGNLLKFVCSLSNLRILASRGYLNSCERWEFEIILLEEEIANFLIFTSSLEIFIFYFILFFVIISIQTNFLTKKIRTLV